MKASQPAIHDVLSPGEGSLRPSILRSRRPTTGHGGRGDSPAARVPLPRYVGSSSGGRPVSWHLTWPILLTCGWLAGTISGAAGFGGAMLLLPVLTLTVGARAAVPILTVAQLLGNLSRACFGRGDIRWRPALLFSLGAVPASLLGSRLFVELSAEWLPRAIGVFLIAVVILRHTPLGKRRVPEPLLAPAGAAVGLISGVAGSAGPLGAAAFLGLRLEPHAYVATEAVTAALMHLTKEPGLRPVRRPLALRRPQGAAPGQLARPRIVDRPLAHPPAPGERIPARGRGPADRLGVDASVSESLGLAWSLLTPAPGFRVAFPPPREQCHTR